MPLAVVITTAACGEAGAPAREMAASRAVAPPGAPVPVGAQEVMADQRLIRSGELEVEVLSVEGAVDRADSISRSMDGLVTDARASEDGNGKHQAHVSLRVPADRFTDAMRALKGLGTTKSEATAQQDITRAYLDLETRLAVKEQTVARLRQLLTDRTGKLADVLQVERELSRVVTELEQMKGERRYYDNQVALATIALTLFEHGAEGAPSGMSIGMALGQSLQLLNTSVGWLLYLTTFLAPWLALAAGGWWLVRAIRRRRTS